MSTPLYSSAAYDVYKRQVLYLPLFLDNAMLEEHKSGIDIRRDLLRRSPGAGGMRHNIIEAMKDDIAAARRSRITATTLGVS